MPLHNTKGKSSAAKKRYSKESVSPGAAKYAASVARLRRFVTQNFHSNHVALTSNPDFSKKLGNASRPIASSTCLVLTPADLAKFESMINGRKKKGVVPGAHADRSVIYNGEKTFPMMVWGPSGKGELITGTFSYSFLRLKNGGPWYVHHLEASQVEISHAVESESDEELYFSDYESDNDLYFSDYESDEDDNFGESFIS